MQPTPPVSPFGTSTPGEFLAESLLESFGLPLLALLITALGRRVIEGTSFDKWKNSADIAMDATMIGATACGTVFVSPFLEQMLRHTAGYATGAVFLCFVFWVALLGNQRSQPAVMTSKEGRWNLLLGSLGLFLPAFFFLWGFFEYKMETPGVK